MARISIADAGGKNMLAFLDTIAFSEIGLELLKESDDGYNVIVGSVPGKPILFTNYADHPHIHEAVAGVQSDAAGRYQFLGRFWVQYKIMMKLPDFSPDSQDRLALRYIRECHAVGLIMNGQIGQAIMACKSRWASFPGAGYNQHENKMDALRGAYMDAGGSLTAI